mmetsp:Transcript_64752/g.107621  ORF Transcript_64752/g.107621 Transcript_64752/m.107621 type:complete len:88 (-) Transcript_64752:111-374(-)
MFQVATPLPLKPHVLRTAVGLWRLQVLQDTHYKQFQPPQSAKPARGAKVVVQPAVEDRGECVCHAASVLILVQDAEQGILGDQCQNE